MRRLTGPGARILAMSWLAFIPLGLLLPTPILLKILNSICVATYLGVLVMFWEGVWSILARPPSSWRAGDVLVLGVVMIATGLSVSFAEWVDRLVGMPQGPSTLVAAFARWIVASGGALLLLAAGSRDGSIQTRAYRQAGIVVALGLGAAMVLMSLGVA